MRQWLLLVGSYPFQCLLCQSMLLYALGQCVMHAQSVRVPVGVVEDALRQVPRLPIPQGFLVQSRWLADRHHRLSCNFPGYTGLFLYHSMHKNCAVLCLMLLHMRVRPVNNVAVSRIDHLPGISHARCHSCLFSMLLDGPGNFLVWFQP